MPHSIEVFATILFALAVLHTFSVKLFQKLAHRFPEGSVGENVCHLLGEVEIIFGLWAGLLILTMTATIGGHGAIEYLETRNYTEPAFVFAIMAMAATRPVLDCAQGILSLISKIIPLPSVMSFYVATLVLGPLLGSFITEPAAMTVTALILKRAYFDQPMSVQFKYFTLGVLFVNVSAGGTLTHYAAPPVLMVARTWNWDTFFMLTHYGWKVALATTTSTLIALYVFRKELLTLRKSEEWALQNKMKLQSPKILMLIHLGFLGMVVSTGHHIPVFMGIFLFFLGMTVATREYQDQLKMRESLLVGFFLAGLVTLGGLQRWWLEPILHSLSAGSLFFSVQVTPCRS